MKKYENLSQQKIKYKKKIKFRFNNQLVKNRR